MTRMLLDYGLQFRLDLDEMGQSFVKNVSCGSLDL